MEKDPFTKWFDFMVDVGSYYTRTGQNWCYTFLHYAEDIPMGSTSSIRECWGGNYNWKFRYMPSLIMHLSIMIKSHTYDP